MPLTFVVDEICPKCSKPIKIAVIELHPSRPDLAVHNFEWADCGPVRAKLPLTMIAPLTRARGWAARCCSTCSIAGGAFASSF